MNQRIEIVVYEHLLLISRLVTRNTPPNAKNMYVPINQDNECTKQKIAEPKNNPAAVKPPGAFFLVQRPTMPAAIKNKEAIASAPELKENKSKIAPVTMETIPRTNFAVFIK